MLTKHLRMHGEGRFPCPSCNTVSTSGLALHDHMRAHFKSLIVGEEGEANVRKIKKRKNKISQKGLTTSQSQFGPVPTELGRQKFACPEPECSLSSSMRRRPFFYPSAKAFASHMVTVHGKKPFGCDVCGTRYHKKV